MLNHPNGITPMVDEDGKVSIFSTMADAYKAGRNNMLGEAYGFEVFCIGCGE